MKFKIITLGCKVNAYESEYIKEKLLLNNFFVEENNPDIIIINTCSVTNMADNKSLKTVRREKRENPSSILVVCGCSTQTKKEQYEDLDIHILIGNKDKNKIVDIILEYLNNHQKYISLNDERVRKFEDMNLNKYTTHTRAFIKIQDGCNNFCSYCIIPYVRGSIRSKDFDTVIKEANTLVNNNHQEIVLTGIHTGSYNSNNHDLSDLIIELAKIENLKRIRISSIEITELDEKFMNVLKTCPKVVDHLHIPLQAGSDKVLKVMNRKYNKEYFRNKIAEIRKIRPNIAITTDIIVGHPYEEEKDFLECLEFSKEIAFAKIHVFPYSIREKTASSLMPQVDNKVKKERAKQLIALSDTLQSIYINKFIGEEMEVLTEEKEGEYIVGHTSNYLKVYLKEDLKLNTLYKVKLIKYEKNILYGTTCVNSKISI